MLPPRDSSRVFDSDPRVSGSRDDAALLNDALITYDPGLESCLFVNGLEPGMYEVTMYAWMPNAPSVFSRVRHIRISRRKTNIILISFWRVSKISRLRIFQEIYFLDYENSFLAIVGKL